MLVSALGTMQQAKSFRDSLFFPFNHSSSLLVVPPSFTSRLARQHLIFGSRRSFSSSSAMATAIFQAVIAANPTGNPFTTLHTFLINTFTVKIPGTPEMIVALRCCQVLFALCVPPYPVSIADRTEVTDK